MGGGRGAPVSHGARLSRRHATRIGSRTAKAVAVAAEALVQLAGLLPVS